jgi:hypothetical protein
MGEGWPCMPGACWKRWIVAAVRSAPFGDDAAIEAAPL